MPLTPTWWKIRQQEVMCSSKCVVKGRKRSSSSSSTELNLQILERAQ
jgi:hypothetical protein